MSFESEKSIRDVIIDCLNQQLSEFDLLKSMYPNDNEVVLTDNNTINSIRSFLEKQSEYTPYHLDFIINILISGMKLEVCINLPTLYPNEEPDIYIRCNKFNRHQESKINLELSNYIKSNHLGEVCLYTAISWLQDNIDTFIEIPPDDFNAVDNTENNHLKENRFVRLWIYSHHIYNKKKRDEIVKKAKELKLTGFCVPGKPGIVCIEGMDFNCNEWWKDIKSMNWKKIAVRKTEVFDISEQGMHQKFLNFEEKHFKNSTSKHSDMKEFSKFMEEHGLSKAFNDVFGFCNDI
ncbi:unnamed protein product [Diatraea saccharalis]|uniref:RWD domain-containing protein n=1 Tax=Diatraea saccharalis TaxID=40085 RepID=A0A9N9WIB5_9NEOP|nr:unnamed protein product [Diatraea saccharalis]